jgi:hypothetical protein
MQTKTKTIIIIVIILIATAGFGIYLFQKNRLVIPAPSSQNIEQSAAEESQQPEPEKTDFGIKEYSYKDVVYNFWGTVSDITGDTVSVNGVIPDPGADPLLKVSRQTITFTVSPSTKIVKLEQVGSDITSTLGSIDLIQMNDMVGVKADVIGAGTKEAVAMDVVDLKNTAKNPSN